MSKSIKNWNEDERPREKLLKWGAETLSLAELLAILINTGSAERSAIDIAKELLSANNHDLNRIAKLKPKQIAQIKGIGPAKAVTIVAALELNRRRKVATTRPVINSVETAVDILRPLLQDKSEEEFIVLYLTRNNKLIQHERIGQGGLTGVFVDPKLIFKHALLLDASAIILAHNHPSGNTNASRADMNITDRLQKAGKIFEIDVHDHIIIAGDGYVSFSEEGLLSSQ